MPSGSQKLNLSDVLASRSVAEVFPIGAFLIFGSLVDSVA